MQIEENVPLAPHTTFRIGGAARYFCEITSPNELPEAQAFAMENGVPLLALGGGSNVLFLDEGFPGLVARMATRGVSLEEHGGSTLLVAEAGEPWDALVRRAVESECWGVENLSGIPGSAGASPVQNIGAYGAELSQTLAWVEALDTVSGEIGRFSGAECGFGYRTSVFKREPGRFVILRLALSLNRAGAPNLAYRDLAEYFAGSSVPSLADIRRAVLAIRARKFPDLELEGTAGSFFLNPVVAPRALARVLTLAPDVPQHPAHGGVKIPLAYLLDRALGLKGLAVGGARLFERQPIVVVAVRGTHAADVLALSALVKEKVRSAFGIELEEEVRIIS